MNNQDDYLSLSGKQRRELLDQSLALHGYICCICGLSIKPGDESLQHITPRSKGGLTTLANTKPAHKRCNYSLGNRELPLTSLVHSGLNYFTRPGAAGQQRPITPAKPPEREVILISGAPGSGKSTLAQKLAKERGLRIFDSDEAEWGSHHGKQFKSAMRNIGRDPQAKAVVIVSGATQQARDAAANTVRATETRLLIEDRDTLIKRVLERNRQTTPVKNQIKGVDDWLKRYDLDQAKK